MAADFVDSVDAADDEHLVVEFRRNSHVTVEVQLIVVSDERLGRSTTCKADDKKGRRTRKWRRRRAEEEGEAEKWGVEKGK